MKIDIFTHIYPPKYKDALAKEMGADFPKSPHTRFISLYDLDYRFRIMDKFDGLMHVLTIAAPAVESIVNPQKATELAKLANDGMAELVLKYPDRFAAAVACLPMDDMNAALAETDRAIKDLKFRGVQIYTPTNDKPLDSPEFMPLYEKMSHYNLPIWIHPQKSPDYPDYRTEKASKYNINMVLGWVYETGVAIYRLVMSGIMEKYPGLKFITHHGGGIIPFLHKRIQVFMDTGEMLSRNSHKEVLRQFPLDYFKMFYADTAIYGNTAGLMCDYDFFGAQHVLFGTDLPYDHQYGLRITRETIEAIEQMAIGDAEKKMIFEDNARRLLRLPI